MGLLRWLKGQPVQAGEAKLEAWRRAWQTACTSPDAAGVASLSTSLDEIAGTADDVEIEREMLDGLEQLVALETLTAAGGLPVIETGHKVVGVDRCHFSAPASMPDDVAQPSGRFIVTDVKAIFAGGGKTTTVAWHAVVEVLQQERDLILVRNDRETFYRFRFNVFADALSAAFVARTLARRRV